MRIFIFKSERSLDLRAFSYDQEGNKLPALQSTLRTNPRASITRAGISRQALFRAVQRRRRSFDQSHNISGSISSIESGEIPSSPNPGISGDATLSICISSAWFRVIGGRGSISADLARTCPAAKGTWTNLGLRWGVWARGVEQCVLASA